MADENSPDDVNQRLVIVQKARDFAVGEFLLPNGKSYRAHADMGLDYVVRNVFAAPEFSLERTDRKFYCSECSTQVRGASKFGDSTFQL